MLENEFLYPDRRTVNRWHPLAERLGCGETPDSIFPVLQRQFYLALRNVFKQWKNRGTGPKELFESATADDRHLMRDLVRRTRNDDFAQLLEHAIDGEISPDLETVIRSFLTSVWENVRDHLQLDRSENDVPEAFLERVNQMLDRLTRDLHKDPSRVPRCPGRSQPPRDIDDVLGESLPLV